MRFRRLMCFVLGLWLGGGLLMLWLAATGFSQVDRIMAEPGSPAGDQIRSLGYSRARDLLRYQVAEQNRFYFENWEIAQLVGGSVFFLYLLFGTTEKKFGLIAVAAMVLIAAGQRFALTPEMAAVEGSIQRLPPETSGQRREAFWIMHSAYMGLESLKWGLVLTLAARNIAGRRRSRSDDAGDEFDLVDKPNYGHVNR